MDLEPLEHFAQRFPLWRRQRTRTDFFFLKFPRDREPGGFIYFHFKVPLLFYTKTTDDLIHFHRGKCIFGFSGSAENIYRPLGPRAGRYGKRNAGIYNSAGETYGRDVAVASVAAGGRRPPLLPPPSPKIKYLASFVIFFFIVIIIVSVVELVGGSNPV